MFGAIFFSLVTMTVSRAPQAPRLDDFSVRQPASAAAITDFRQRDPHDGAPASRATTAYISYDDQNLYAVFVCKDDPAAIRARMSRREDIEQDDQVVLMLDTFHDRRRAYIFIANPLGIQRDGIMTEGQKDDFTFDAVWSAEGRLTPDGYLVRITIPFRSLRFPDSPAQTWGIAVGRLIPLLSEESYWPAVTKRVNGFVQQMATLEGIERVPAGRNMQFAPYVAASRARFLDRNEPAFRNATEQRTGMDAKAVFRDSITLDATINPDFSQVESNEPQVTVNQRFEVFFPERRPFFLENAGLLQTPVNLFFSRRVADPQVGIRLSGKADRYAFGVVASDDRSAGLKLAVGDARRNENASIGVARIQREIGKESTLGVFVSDRRFANSTDRMLAIDTRMKLNAHWSLQAQAMRSNRQLLDGSARDGSGFFAELKRSGRNFDYTARYTDFSPKFAAPLGFVKRADVRQFEHSAKYRWRPADSVITKFGPSAQILGDWDHKGGLQDWQAQGGFKVELTGRTEIELLHSQLFERFTGAGFRKHSTALTVTSEWLEWLTGSAAISRGTEINRDTPRGVAAFLGQASDAAFTVSVMPAPHVRVDTTLLWSGMTANAQSVFSNQVARWKVNYQVSPRLSLRTIIDYDRVIPNASLTRLERTSFITSDFLMTYMVAPGTAAYVGWTDRRENLLLNDEAAIGRSQSTISTSRQVFAKVSYLWRY